MAETAMFSRLVTNAATTDSLYISLSTDLDISVTAIIPQRLEIAEAFSSATPAVSFDFVDGNGDVVNLQNIPMDAVFYLDIGTSPIDANRIELRCSKMQIMNKTQNSSEQIAIRMTFVHKGWSAFQGIQHNRGWKETRYSDIVKELVTEAGYATDSISESADIPEIAIQPYMSNFGFIRYLAGKTYSENGGGIEFGATTDNRFIYKTTGDMIIEQYQDAIDRKLPVFRMEGQILDPIYQYQQYRDNSAPTYFVHFAGERDYLRSILGGAGGVRAMYFDSETGQYKNEEIRYSDLEAPQMTDWSGVCASDEVMGRRVFGGRDADTITEASNRLIDNVDAIARFEISTERAADVHIGDMVEVIIPTPNAIGSNVPQNIFYSGFYLICGVTTVVNLQTSAATSTIQLMREGYDGKQLTGRVKSKYGKFVEK